MLFLIEISMIIVISTLWCHPQLMFLTATLVIQVNQTRPIGQKEEVDNVLEFLIRL
jgi:hypothetical protein